MALSQSIATGGISCPRPSNAIAVDGYQCIGIAEQIAKLVLSGLGELVGIVGASAVVGAVAGVAAMLGIDGGASQLGVVGAGIKRGIDGRGEDC